jgi:hypothetical protein
MRASCQTHSELANRESGEEVVKSTAPVPEGPEDRDICMSGAEQARTDAGAAAALCAHVCSRMLTHADLC